MLQSTVIAAVRALYSRAAGQGQKSFDLDYQIRRELASGVLAGQADLAYKSAAGGISIAASGFNDIDTNGATLDAIGDALALVKVKEILLFAYESNVNNVVVGGAASNPFLGPFVDATDKIKVGPGGFFHWYDPAGAVVTPTTADLLRVANGAGGSAVLFDLILLGTSA